MVWEVEPLIQAVGDLLNARFGAVAVRGELSGFSRAPSGHCYFTLKSAQGRVGLRCAMFRRSAGLLDFTPADGQLVEVRGRLAVFEARGELQLIVESMQRAGAGALMEQFLRLKARLQAEGLFAPERKQAIPLYPARLGVVTSLAAAALRDVLTTLARRAPHVAVVVYPALVQGAEAPASIVAAIQAADARAEVDTLLVCRGGGSLEDLWSFNDERVVRAVAACRLPVISGVGHETDITLVDFVADLRAPTPTAAAELAAPSREDGLNTLRGARELLRRRLDNRLDREAQRLDQLSLRLARPAALMSRHHQRLALLEQRHRAGLRLGLQGRGQGLLRLGERLQAAGQRQRMAARVRIDLLEQRLQALDPGKVLARGYAWVADETGRPLVSVAQIGLGQTLQARLADGQVDAVVARIASLEGQVIAGTVTAGATRTSAESTVPPASPGAAAAARPRARKRSKAVMDAGVQPSLDLSLPDPEGPSGP